MTFSLKVKKGWFHILLSEFVSQNNITGDSKCACFFVLYEKLKKSQLSHTSLPGEVTARGLISV